MKKKLSLSIPACTKAHAKLAESAFSLYYHKVKTGSECIKEQKEEVKIAL